MKKKRTKDQRPAASEDASALCAAAVSLSWSIAVYFSRHLGQSPSSLALNEIVLWRRCWDCASVCALCANDNDATEKTKIEELN